MKLEARAFKSYYRYTARYKALIIVYMLIKEFLSIEVSILDVSGADSKLQRVDRLNVVSLYGEYIKTELSHISRINVQSIYPT